MKIINDSMNAPLRYIVGERILGQYYNSRDKTYHLCEYVPYTGGPKAYLCGGIGNFSPSRSENELRNKCQKCFNLANI